MSIRLARSLGVALVLPTLATLAALAHAQTSADARHHPGTLRFERIEQEVPNATTLAAGRAMLAVFDSALAALPEVRNPRGYDVIVEQRIDPYVREKAYRSAQPFDFYISASFPYAVYNVDTHQWGESEVRAELDISANHPCMFTRAGGLTTRKGDDAGAFYAKPDTVEQRGDEFRFGNRCIVLTHVRRPFWLPVSRERYLNELIHEQQGEAKRAGARPIAMGDNLRMLLSLDSTHKSVAPAMKAEYEQKKKTDPKDAEREYQQFLDEGRELDSSIAAERAHATDHPEVNAVAGGVLNDLQAELAALTPAQRAAPAYWSGAAQNASHLVDGPGPGVEQIVTPNPAFYDRTLPRTAAQMVSIEGDLTERDRAYTEWMAEIIGRIRESVDRSKLERVIAP